MSLGMLGSSVETRLISQDEHAQSTEWTREPGGLKAANPLTKA